MDATDAGRESPEALVAALCSELAARAAGLWRVEEGRLTQVAFVAGPALPEEVARGFAEATRSVALDQVGLGIVVAARSGEPAVSVASALPEEGSGRWLRQFGASRSVAVPLRGADGAVAGVLSVALASEAADDRAVAERIRSAGRAWAGSLDRSRLDD